MTAAIPVAAATAIDTRPEFIQLGRCNQVGYSYRCIRVSDIQSFRAVARFNGTFEMHITSTLGTVNEHGDWQRTCYVNVFNTEDELRQYWNKTFPTLECNYLAATPPPAAVPVEADQTTWWKRLCRGWKDYYDSKIN